jgi:23S rRNA pseudouridine2605 synthase
MNEKRSTGPRPRKAGGERPLRRRKDDAAPTKRQGEKPAFPPRWKRQDAAEDQGAAPRFGKPRPAKPQWKDAAKTAPSPPQEKPHPGERVAKVMARAGACSRRDAEQWIAEGRVAVNGRTLASPAFNVRDGDAITIDGQPLAERERTRLFLFHKPAGLVTSAKDPEGRATVFGFIAERHPELPRLVSIGRLDINTEGLLLLSNDGALARVLELPATGWTRRYRVRAHGDVDQAMLDPLAKGVTVDDVDYAPIEARLDRIQGANAWITMALSEGKNREIKRVLEHLGLDVARLIRVSFGPFQLGDLAEGAIEEVRLKTLREQLGKGLAELAGVDFSSPLREQPSATEREAARASAENRPRKHVSTLRRQRAETADEKAPRARIERGVTADRKGRAVAVERVVVKTAKGFAPGRNARRFEALRHENETAGSASSRPTPARREREAREGEGFGRARKPREAGGFGSRTRDHTRAGLGGGDRRRSDDDAPAFRREAGVNKARDDRGFGSRQKTGGDRDRSFKPLRGDAGEDFAGRRREGAPPHARFKRDGDQGAERPRKPFGEGKSNPPRERGPAQAKGAPLKRDASKGRGEPRGASGKGKPPNRPRGGPR